MPPLQALRPRLVVLGSGWGAFNFLQRIDKRKFEVTCVSPSNHFLFTPLLPSAALGTVEFRAIQEPIRCLKGMEKNYLQAKARTLDTRRKVVTCEDIFKKEPPFEVPYDFLVLATGFKTNTFGIESVNRHEGHSVFFLKHLYHARMVRNRILECFERASIPGVDPEEKDRLLNFIIVGGGPTSIEFSGELMDFLREDVVAFYPELRPHVRVKLVEAGPKFLSTFDQHLVSYIQGRFSREGVVMKLNTAVKGLSEDGNTCYYTDGTSERFGMMVWNAGIAPTKFIEYLRDNHQSEISFSRNSRVAVDGELRVLGGIERCFALGDCAAMEKTPLPQLAQVAQQQGKYLARKFNRVESDDLLLLGDDDASIDPDARDKLMRMVDERLKEPTRPFRYYSMGSMATLGGFRGVADFSHVGTPGEGQTERNLGTIRGIIAFVMWRTAYLGRQVSLENKITIVFYWIKTWLWGRDISRF